MIATTKTGNTTGGTKAGLTEWVSKLTTTQQMLYFGGAFVGVLLVFALIYKQIAAPPIVQQQRPLNWEQTSRSTSAAELFEQQKAAREREEQQRMITQLQQDLGALRQDLIDTRNALTGMHDRVAVLEARRGRVEIIKPDDYIRQQGHITPPRRAPDRQQSRVLATVGERVWRAEDPQNSPPSSSAKQASRDAIATAE